MNLKDKRPSLTINFEDGFDDFYLVKHDIDINDLKLQHEEVQKVMWADKNEIINMIDAGYFIPYYKSFIELLFDMKNCMGTHSKK
ncbi:hypothetical protein GNF81_20640 [Clostridium perfringens]|uniref:NUDIX hydrolase n=1 Tax=Clostridium perfringens TaxID=1502 RepID=A0AAW9J9J4_CLOPF|nr:hypothetical protein [Clostridium perfringens]